MANTIYNVSQCNTNTGNCGVLIDHEANKSLARQNTVILNITSRSVEIQKIDDYQMVNIPIITTAKVVETQQRHAILIINQYANIKHRKNYLFIGSIKNS